jgi:hypothetical protein
MGHSAQENQSPLTVKVHFRDEVAIVHLHVSNRLSFTHGILRLQNRSDDEDG